MPSHALISLDSVIVAVTDDAPRVLVMTDGDAQALPSGPLDLLAHPTLERGMRAWVAQRTGLTLGHVEQLYTFGDRFRDPREAAGGPRVISTAYLALVREGRPADGFESAWADWYGFLPWEDWRAGRPALLETRIRPLLREFAARLPENHARACQCFGLEGWPWDPERSLERYELLWEAGLVAEARRGRETAATVPGRPMARDHRRILATALGRLRGKLKYRPLVFELLPERFTLGQLQRLVEALAGQPLHTQNFRRLVANAGLVEATGQQIHATGGRPAGLFRFRREVLHERPAPGVGLPKAVREA
ncbi:MAG: hypothetical protein IT479_02725 [Xanthomonadales bacterium]|nr:hypothetical protein [Xanthomonadales bacterium]MCC6592164.1 hypothetical protein [Xanthomonadales bacterium]MCE7931930.1 hypothetical protein [Xanthomonadales bacterium PRO6]